MGIAGSIMTGLYGIRGGHEMWLHDIGRGLVLQGVFIGLVLGVGGLALPLMTRGQPPPDGAATPADTRSRLGHAAGALVLLASFFVQYAYSIRVGLALRGAVVLAVLLLSAEIWRAPTTPGLNRRVLWTAAGCCRSATSSHGVSGCVQGQPSRRVHRRVRPHDALAV
jgi:uncharacterized protein involved in response to NO